jgi:hypothetical protein
LLLSAELFAIAVVARPTNTAVVKIVCFTVLSLSLRTLTPYNPN